MDRFYRRRLPGPAATIATALLLVLGAAPATALAAGEEAPSFATGPVVTGQAVEGTLLEISASVNGNPEPDTAFEWSRCDSSGLACAVIDGACASSYVLTAADVGSRILAREQLSNPSGTVVRRAPFTDVVTAAPPGTTPAPPPDPGTCIPRAAAPPAPPAAPTPAAAPPAPRPPAAPPAPTAPTAPRAPGAAPAAPGAPAPVVTAAAYMRPFPIVRIRGFAVRRGVRVTLLTVSGPRTARVRVVCRGGGCPRRSTLRPVRAPARLRRLERVFRSGTVIQIRITAPGSIGKYTSFRIRRGRAPRRVDRCLLPGRVAPAACPAA